MPYFTHLGTLADGAQAYLTAVTGLQVAAGTNGARLYSASAADTGAGGGVLVWDMAGTGAATVIRQGNYTITGDGLPAPGGITICELGGRQYVLAYGQSDPGVAGFRFSDTGDINGRITLDIGVGALTALVCTPPDADGDVTFYSTARDTPGIAVQNVAADGSAGSASMVAADAGVVTALLRVTADGRDWLIATHPDGQAVASYQIAPDGSLSAAGSAGTAQGLFMTVPDLLQSVVLDGVTYVLAGDAGTSTIAVMELAADGTLIPRDQIGDTLDTRFQAISVLDSVTVGDRVFVIAGGGDDGLTLMTLLPGGRLLHLETIPDDLDMALAGLSALEMHAVGGRIDVFATGFRDPALTRLSVDPGDGDLLTGTAGADVLVGTAYGDIIMDGAGSDVMTGGAGADVFVMARDGVADTITDFRQGTDRIDLSAWGRIYGPQGLDIAATGSGMTITYGSETLHVQAASGTTIDIDALRAADLVDLWHLTLTPAMTPPPSATVPRDDARRTIAGTDDVDRIAAPSSDAAYDAIAAQVVRLYQATLGRSPDTVGHQSWSRILDAGQQTLVQVADGFMGSAEFTGIYGATGTSAFVTLLYENVLGRAPDGAGLAAWSNAIDTGTRSRAEVVLGFSESAEFIARTADVALQYALASAQAIWADDVFRLYQATLDRAPDEAGLLGWSAALGQGRSYLDTVQGFVDSPEFQAKYGSSSNVDFVTLLYNNVLDRAPEGAGLTGWTDLLDSGARSRTQVVQGFAQSLEFIAKTAAPLHDWMNDRGVVNRVDGAGGDDLLFGSPLVDAFVFRAGDAGHDTLVGLDAWDRLEFEGFGYADAADARAQFSQAGQDVLFADGDVAVTFVDTDLAMMSDAMIWV